MFFPNNCELKQGYKKNILLFIFLLYIKAFSSTWHSKCLHMFSRQWVIINKNNACCKGCSLPIKNAQQKSTQKWNDSTYPITVEILI